MKAGALLNQCRQPSPDRNLPAAGGGDAREQFQYCGFAGAVVSDNAERFAFPYLKADIAQRPHVAGSLYEPAAVPPPGSIAVGAKFVFLRDVVELDVNHV